MFRRYLLTNTRFIVLVVRGMIARVLASGARPPGVDIGG
jgi:hypothetical protein